MSYRFSDNSLTPLYSATVSTGTPIIAGPVKVIDFETFCFQAVWTSTLAGTILVKGSLDGTNFYEFGVGVSTQPSGSTSGVLIPLFGHGMKWLELVFTRSGGSGLFTVTSLGKTR